MSAQELLALHAGSSQPIIECEQQLRFLSRNKPGRFALYAFNDPSHGWVRVRKDVLKTLGIADKVSPCSYQRNQFAYLEEDADASLLVKTLEARGIEVVWREKNANGQSSIRKFEPYRSA